MQKRNGELIEFFLEKGLLVKPFHENYMRIFAALAVNLFIVYNEDKTAIFTHTKG